MTKQSKEQPKKQQPKYKVILQTVGKEYKSEGKTVFDAIKGLGLEWHQIKNKGVIVVKKDKLKLEHLFYINQLKRIFANKTVMSMWSKRLDLLLTQKDGNNI